MFRESLWSWLTVFCRSPVPARHGPRPSFPEAAPPGEKGNPDTYILHNDTEIIGITFRLHPVHQSKSFRRMWRTSRLSSVHYGWSWGRRAGGYVRWGCFFSSFIQVLPSAIWGLQLSRQVRCSVPFCEFSWTFLIILIYFDHLTAVFFISLSEWTEIQSSYLSREFRVLGVPSLRISMLTISCNALARSGVHSK